MPLAVTTGLMIVAGMVVWEIIRWSVQRFLKKTAGTQYVTVEACSACRNECKVSTGSDRKELLATIAKLDGKVDQLRSIIIRHLLLNTIDDEAGRRELEKMLNA